MWEAVGLNDCLTLCLSQPNTKFKLASNTTGACSFTDKSSIESKGAAFARGNILLGGVEKVGESMLVRGLEDMTDMDLIERQDRLDEKLHGDGLLVRPNVCNLLTGLLNGGNGGLFADIIGSRSLLEFSMIDVLFESMVLPASILPAKDSSKVCELSISGDIAPEYVVGTDGIPTVCYPRVSLNFDFVSPA